MSRRRRPIVCVVLAMLLIAFTPAVTEACKLDALLRKLVRAVAQGDILRACQIMARIAFKYPGTPPPPGAPTADECADEGVDTSGGGGGRGRGGGMGGGSPPGGMAGGMVFGFNAGNPAECFDYTITPHDDNPAGFTVLDPSGTLMIPLGEVATIPFTVEIDSAVAPGTMAFFEVVLVDCDNGEPVPDGFKTAKVTATADVEIIHSTDDFRVLDGQLFTAKWIVRNTTAVQITKDYTFVMVPDPGSIANLSDGTEVAVPDGFSLPRSNMGGSATLEPAGMPGDEVEIEWDMEPGEYCDPAMITCCGMEIDGALAMVHFVNTADVTERPCCAGSLFVIEGVSQGGTIDIVVNDFDAVVIPLPPGLNGPQVVDAITLGFNQVAHDVDHFNYAAVPDQDEIGFMHAGETVLTMFVNDPGLFAVRLPMCPVDFTDVLPFMDPENGDMGVKIVPHGLPEMVEVEIEAMQLTGNNNVPFNTFFQPVQLTAPELSSINAQQQSGQILINQGATFTETLSYGGVDNDDSEVVFTAVTVDQSPLFSNDNAFNVLVDMVLGSGVELRATIQIRPYGLPPAGPPVKPPIDPDSISATLTGETTFDVSYSAMAPAPLIGVVQITPTAGCVTSVPVPCPTQAGDTNGDGSTDGDDIQPFVGCILTGGGPGCGCADMDGDGDVDTDDVDPFVQLLVGG